MLHEIVLTKRVLIPTDTLNKNKEVPASVVANKLLKQLSYAKACEDGYFLAVTKLISIGHGDDTFYSEHILFPVDFRCRMFIPMAGEVMMGIVHRINELGVFLRSGPMNFVYLAGRMMPNYNYVMGEIPSFLREDSSKIGIGVVVRYKVLAVRWVGDRLREFRVLARIDGDGLGPVSSNGLDGMEML